MNHSITHPALAQLELRQPDLISSWWQDFASLAGQAHQLQDLLQQADRLRQQQLSMGGPGKGLSDQQGTGCACSTKLQMTLAEGDSSCAWPPICTACGQGAACLADQQHLQRLQRIVLELLIHGTGVAAVAVMAEKAIMQRKAGAGGVPVEVLQSINEQLAA